MKNEVETIFVRWIATGGCPCCFPNWEYDNVTKPDVWGWIDKYSAYEFVERVLSDE